MYGTLRVTLTICRLMAVSERLCAETTDTTRTMDILSNGFKIRADVGYQCLWRHLHLHGIRGTPLWRRRRCPCYGSIGDYNVEL
jgi:hypothetical protein